ncbi:MAG: hypothetical protein LBR80_08530 [Deltaproteobacteria bacterium]|jgi:hypothetical protein|nr:hypothetical protein [Deltaproteobacteria bacterium]
MVRVLNDLCIVINDGKDGGTPKVELKQTKEVPSDPDAAVLRPQKSGLQGPCSRDLPKKAEDGEEVRKTVNSRKVKASLIVSVNVVQVSDSKDVVPAV